MDIFSTSRAAISEVVVGGIILIASVVIAGCDRAPSERAQDSEPAVTQAAPTQPDISKPQTPSHSIYVDSQEVPVTEKAVSLVNSVSLDFLDPLGRSMLIKASGTAPGGRSPALLPIDESEPDSSIRRFRFVAISDSNKAIGDQAVYVQLRADIPREVNTIEVVAEQNAVSVKVVRPTNTTDIASAP